MWSSELRYHVDLGCDQCFGGMCCLRLRVKECSGRGISWQVTEKVRPMGRGRR
jgi:hypothetical protein